MRDSYKYSLHTDIEEDKGMDQGPGQWSTGERMGLVTVQGREFLLNFTYL